MKKGKNECEQIKFQRSVIKEEYVKPVQVNNNRTHSKKLTPSKNISESYFCKE